MEKGELICDQCNGEGIRKILGKPPSDELWYKEYYMSCTKCNGTGIINWLQNVFYRNNCMWTIEARNVHK